MEIKLIYDEGRKIELNNIGYIELIVDGETKYIS